MLINGVTATGLHTYYFQSYSADALNRRRLCEHAYYQQDDRSHSLVGRQVPELGAGERFESCEGIITLQQALQSKTEAY